MVTAWHRCHLFCGLFSSLPLWCADVNSGGGGRSCEPGGQGCGAGGGGSCWEGGGADVIGEEVQLVRGRVEVRVGERGIE